MELKPSDSAAARLYEELWRACAGPLVSLPKLKQLVVYFPQGHIEQVLIPSPSSLRIRAVDREIERERSMICVLEN
jgi:hypothetical protein